MILAPLHYPIAHLTSWRRSIVHKARASVWFCGLFGPLWTLTLILIAALLAAAINLALLTERLFRRNHERSN